MSSSEPTAGVLIVGASIAGTTVAETLRAEGHEGTITLLGRERHLPYSRPPLSKQVLGGDWTAAQALIHDADGLDALGVAYRPHETAVALDLGRRVVTTSRSALAFDRLVIATGAAPRRLPGTDGVAGVCTLRTLDDAESLRDRLRPGRRIVVVGGGVLGCEVAAAARKAGCDVTLVCRGGAPRIGATGDVLSSLVASVLREHGVALRTDAGVAAVRRAGAGLRVLLADGAELDADTVVAAIGCEPETGWLRTSGLDVSDGVLCDPCGRADDGVYAVGDVARWRDGATGRARRVEHQLTAIEQAQAVASHIVHGRGGDPVVPFFWTELFGSRILVHGVPDPTASMSILEGSVDERRFLASYAADGDARALVAWNMPRELRRERTRTMTPATSRG